MCYMQYSRRAFIVFVKWVFQAFMTQLMCPEQRMEREWRENEKSELPFFFFLNRNHSFEKSAQQP